MWLQKLILLGTVVYSISAPIGPPGPVPQPRKYVDAIIKEALSLLNHSNDTGAETNETEVVSNVFDPTEPTCLQTRLKLYEQDLPGSFTKLKSLLSTMASHYKEYCPPTPGSFSRPQNTSEELCYGEFTKNFTSTLKDLAAKYNHQDCHIIKVYKDMEELTKICPKLEPTDTPKDCTIEQSDFSQFKEALESVIISIEGWKSCQRTDGDLRHFVFSWG
ncbi:Hypothetical predicted protein [Marmota monax]|uniref:Granulocyte-macrophage colony-stimulating factor n=1 Tax=Marmota monax TaxID=9995 RepID=A0A5E4B5T5_MARMO|nr:granulocyte-macrophage colony-stimulating factor [Marmota monax]VTJ64476.1 Hypothetical predicted protein [Marmota monax]